ncbi:MAG: flagellar basal body P-ring protein FlgI [Nitrospiria bacterium]
MLLFWVPSSHAARVKDIASIEGVRNNALIGYGLVIGLNGTGDKTGTLFTVQSLSSMLSRMGITVNPNAVKVKNVAAVMVTATLPPFTRTGTQLDVVVSSMGDATSLQGGTLLLTPLKGPDQVVYAVAQGSVSIGGFVGGQEGDKTQKNHPTAGRVASGALVEREVPFAFSKMDRFKILLRDQDFTTSLRLADTINSMLGGKTPGSPMAHPIDAATVELTVGDEYKGREVALLSMIEGLDVKIDFSAKVVVNERTGTIVMGDQVRISDVAIAHGNLTIRVQTELQVSQPPAFAPKGAETVVVPERDADVVEEDSKIVLVKGGTTIGTLIQGLNSIGVTPRDLISILQAIKAAGALHAELEIL